MLGGLARPAAAVVFCAVLLLGAAVPAASADPTAVVRRTTLVVNDIEASIRFYRDVLGFELWMDNRGKVSASSLPADVPAGSPTRTVVMRGRHPWVGMLGLLQYGPAKPLPAPPAALRPGDAVLMIESDEVEAVFGRMQAAGTRVLRAPETSDVPGAGGIRWTTTWLYAYDPDGRLIEISSRRPAAGAPPAGGASVLRDFVPTRFGSLHVRRSVPSRAEGLRAPVVLLHEPSGSGTMFAALLPQLGRDRIVLAPDAPGRGDSDPLAASAPDGAEAAALEDLLAWLGEPADLVACGGSGALAAQIAQQQPHGVRRLIRIAPPPDAPAPRGAIDLANVDAEMLAVRPEEAAAALREALDGAPSAVASQDQPPGR